MTMLIIVILYKLRYAHAGSCSTVSHIKFQLASECRRGAAKLVHMVGGWTTKAVLGLQNMRCHSILMQQCQTTL